MGVLETTLAIAISQIPTYFIQRYFFKGVMDRHLDRLENKLKNLKNETK